MDAELHERLREAGLGPADFAWLDSFGWDDSRVPAPKASELTDYRRREAALNASVAALTFSERAISTPGKLAAAIGALCADAEDHASGDED